MSALPVEAVADLQERVRELERQVRFERSRADRNAAKVLTRPTGGGLTAVGDAIKHEMPHLFSVVRENQASREREGRAGWNEHEWSRFIVAARDAKATAPRDGIVDRLLGTALLRTVKAVEQMRSDGFNPEKIRQTLVLRKQHESGEIDAQRARMNERTATAGPRRRRAPLEQDA